MEELLDNLGNIKKYPSSDQLKALQSLIDEFSREQDRDKKTLHIGLVDNVNYGILIEKVGTVSMNGVCNASDERPLPNTQRVLRYLTTHSIVGYPPGLVSQRDVFVLGRLRASHHPQQPHSQSHVSTANLPFW